MKRTLVYTALLILVGALLFLVGILFNNFIGFSTFFKEGMNIEKLEHRELKFNELPTHVQEGLDKILKRKSTVKEEKGFLILNNARSYECEVIKTGPSWINYSLLKDLSRGNNYKIPNDAPRPYIIYNNKLYISKEYNIIMLESIYTVKYVEYALK